MSAPCTPYDAYPTIDADTHTGALARCRTQTHTRAMIFENPTLGPRKALCAVACVVNGSTVIVSSGPEIRAFVGLCENGNGRLCRGSWAFGSLSEHAHLLARRRVNVLILANANPPEMCFELSLNCVVLGDFGIRQRLGVTRLLDFRGKLCLDKLLCRCRLRLSLIKEALPVEGSFRLSLFT